ncbi:unnamed protein product [Symbiodinium necroappetens]|uniref:Uncharacterized protein n=1 Tax=Symbiodinium necroappetens TaxID=1628268 RepID=A0A813AAI0_9DINO|nr:unnamed protein product [Symbiodinium necroappetens]
MADPRVTASEIQACLKKYLESVNSKDIWSSVVPPVGGPRTWHWKTRPCARWMAKTAGLMFELLEVARNGKIHSRKLCFALDALLESGDVKNTSGSEKVQKMVDALALLDDCEEEDDHPCLEDSVQIYIEEQDKDEEQSLVPKATEAEMDQDFFRSAQLLDMDANEPEPDVWKKGKDQEILMLAVRHKPSASLPRNSKSKARAPATALQTSESEGESSEAREMVENKTKKQNKKKQEKNNKKHSKKKQEEKQTKQSKKKQEKKKKKPTKDTKKKNKKKKKQDKKDEIEEKKDHKEKKAQVFYEVLVPKAATPKAAPWEAEWYKYSYHGAKHLKTRKGHRKFFMKKARKFLKDKGLA